MTSSVPLVRIHVLLDAPRHLERECVIYWMVAQRRLRHNFALQRAVELANDLGKPLLIFEPLRAGYRWASDRFHRFVLDGFDDHLEALKEGPALYYPYLEPSEGEDKGLLIRLAHHAAALVTDDYPGFFLPRMLASAAEKLDLYTEAVDSNGMLPLRAAEKTYTTAYSFRRGLHKMLPEHLTHAPHPRPLEALKIRVKDTPEFLAKIQKQWPPPSRELMQKGNIQALATLPIDHTVGQGIFTGGEAAATRRLEDFVAHDLPHYAKGRNRIDTRGSSNLSPFLHFGHISVHEVFEAVAARNEWTLDKLAEKPTGKREGWWGMSPDSEAFLDELITWREIGYNMAHREPQRHTMYESLPDWVRITFQEHAQDERQHIYTFEQFERGLTHDSLWNAAHNQLVQEGIMHNYLRMLWGKKILEWTPTPIDALEIMVELNNKYALDGRDPNSYSGIFWVLGRYDRGWTERPIFGKVRYMNSQSTRRKFKVDEYIKTYTATPL